MRKLLLLILFPFIISYAQINIEIGKTINENFNSIGTTANTTLPANWKADKLTSIRTVGNYSTAVANTNYNGGINISASAGNGIYNFGIGDPLTATDRSIGGLSSGSGSQSVNIYSFFKNTGSTAITQVDISYDVYRFRNGSNDSGFAIQLYYSTNGIKWNPAGQKFLTIFSKNADNNGAATVPLETKNILNQSLSGINIKQNDSLFLAWNYSVTSGTKTTNAQALGIDNFVMNNISSGSVTTVPSAPIASAATNIISNSFTANWSSSVGATSYQIDLSTVSDFSSFIAGYSNKDLGNVTSYSITGLVSNTTYYYRVRATNIIGSSSNSSVIQVKTLQKITYVQFSGISDAVVKSAGSYKITLSISEPSLTASTSVKVKYYPDSSSASASYLNNFSESTITFPAGSSTDQVATLTISDNKISELPKKALFRIENASGGLSASVGNTSRFILTITSGTDDSYYNSILSTLTGVQLKNALHELIKNQTKFPYTDSNGGTDVWSILKVSDEDPKNPRNIIGIYSGLSIGKDPQDYWNREHVWSKSHGNFGTVTGAGSDAHHLRPENPSVNTLKGNLDFDIGGIPVAGAPNCKYDSDSWEPRDEVKGDIARMIFYMATRYLGDVGEPNLLIVDYIPSSPANEPLYGKLSTLLKWNLQDPPDAFEMNRNNVVYFYQRNRNPYIDHYDWVTKIWGLPSGIDQNYSNTTLSDYQLYQNYPNPFNPSTTISYQLPKSGFVSIKLFDSLGREISTLVNESKIAGHYQINFDGSKLSSGIYYYQLRANSFIETKKFILMK